MGQDKDLLRFLIVVWLGIALLIGVERGYEELTTSDCDAACQERARQFIQDNAPEVLATPPPGATFSPEDFIRDTLNDP